MSANTQGDGLSSPFDLVTLPKCSLLQFSRKIKLQFEEGVELLPAVAKTHSWNDSGKISQNAGRSRVTTSILKYK